jgi:hypothetical protein
VFARSHGYEVLDLCLIEDYWPTAGSQAPGVPLPVAATVREVAGAEGEVDGEMPRDRRPSRPKVW